MIGWTICCGLAGLVAGLRYPVGFVALVTALILPAAFIAHGSSDLSGGLASAFAGACTLQMSYLVSCCATFVLAGSRGRSIQSRLPHEL